ncbi:MAG: putative AlkP superfamily pyrophosphatase or phosphodiesterase [Candidatus Paceibacteria bacterium]|jgi:predicted AlkP superfamily pyrophosphatase or phosphodiesterase
MLDSVPGGEPVGSLPMQRVLLLNLVGLTRRLIGDHTPHLQAFAKNGACTSMTDVLPAVTCSAQATMLTGLSPQEHGVVGNGWLDPNNSEPRFWQQSNKLVSGELLYEAARKAHPEFTCAKLFWWFNMGAQVDWSITPRPFYCADGLKVLATYSAPSAFGARLEEEFGPFPFFDFWGPKSGLPSSRWITDITLQTMERERPTLTMAYLPHLDYNFQRYGPDDERSVQALKELDVLFGELANAAANQGVEVVAVSEYGIESAHTPIHVNRALREAGLLQVRPSPRGEELDVFASRAFALADHQVAHVYVRDDGDLQTVRELLVGLPGVDKTWAGEERREVQLDHERAGDLVLCAAPGAWFTYYYWTDEGQRPDFAPTVDIHSKPGYDPCELFVDPELFSPTLRVVRRVLQKKLGMRYLMDVIPTDATLVGGSHGRGASDPLDGPVFLSSVPLEQLNPSDSADQIEMASVKERVLHIMRAKR